MKIDIGCGNFLKPGFIGVDQDPGSAATHFCNLDSEPLPFPDNSVSEIYSSHTLEHLKTTNILNEVSRVCRDGARVLFIIPYAWNNDAWVYGHVQPYSEVNFEHICVHFPEFWHRALGVQWLMHEVNYLVPQDIQDELASQRFPVPLKFAVRHLINVVKEISFYIEIKKGPQLIPPIKPAYAVIRHRGDTEKKVLI
jgi:SAM-dependent methyltransferase